MANAGIENKWYVAEGIFGATVAAENADAQPVSENLLFLVQAVDQPAAVLRAEAIAPAKEHFVQE